MDFYGKNNKYKQHITSTNKIINNMVKEINTIDDKYKIELDKLHNKYKIEKQKIINNYGKKYSDNNNFILQNTW